MRARRQKQKPKNAKKLLALSLSAVVLLAAGAVYWYTAKPGTGANVATTEEPAIQDKINYSPPTEEELRASEEAKNRIIAEQEATPPTTENNKKAVTPIINSAYVDGGKVHVRGFVSGTIETTGTCTFVFTKDSHSYTKTSGVIANASTTDCKPLSFDADDLPLEPTGWKVRLTYSSSASEGTSSEQEVMGG